jgi:hypothetical protein
VRRLDEVSGYLIFYPMGALAALTAATIASAGVLRLLAVRRGEISEDFYRLFQGDTRPELEAKLTRHYANLLEWPILFYVAGLAIFATGLVDRTFVALFWGFVAVRVLHAVIHITYNRPTHRAAAFSLGFVLLAAVWARFLILITGPGAAA